MGNRKSTPTNDANSPEEHSPSPPLNSRCSTPQGDRPGNPTPYSHGQGLVQVLHNLPHNGTSGTDSGAAKVDEEGGEAATDSDAAKIEEGEAASSDISDAELEQKKVDSALTQKDRQRNALSLDERSVFAFQEGVYGGARREEERNAAQGNAGGDGKGK